ncbi:apolipoprotein L3-like [Puntigrus tetrazona]|uniref:apolipoprotein L3-like n=1 Tax=Puntigrus tetrazona TaxID=1606681 RepID=UPI001C896EF2|nr:apolipoprotein L3-like [Puntigrus tetrazona]
MDIRGRLQDRLTEYVSDTIGCIETLKDFCDQEQEWASGRKAEIEKLKEIGKNDDVEEEKEKKMEVVLRDTIEGLKKVESFLEAMEKLTVTSRSVFVERVFLLRGERPETVQSVISDAKIDAPILLQFKKKPESFFQPMFDNLEILINQLINYITRTKHLCHRVRQNSVLAVDIYNRNSHEPLVQLILDADEDTMSQMHDTLEQLSQIRMNPRTRLVFLFQDDAQTFVDVYGKCGKRMWQFLADLEERAKKLDSMKYGASVSNVVGSSLGITGGILSILGIVLAPFSAGASLAFTVIGAGLGVTSGANAVVTSITESQVNRYQEQSAQNYLDSYKEDMMKIKESLKEVAHCEHCLLLSSGIDASAIGHNAADIAQTGAGAFEAYAAYKGEKAAETASKFAIQHNDVPEVAAHMAKTKLANTKTLGIVKVSKVASGVVNALFIGLDIYCIVNESISLSQGSKSEASDLIRSRAALFKSELETWEKMHNSLCIGIDTFSKDRDTVEGPFLP